MEAIPAWLVILFFFIALFYSMVGFGGGSSYLAFLVLAGIPYTLVPPIGLSCNLIVTSGGLWHFFRAGHFKFKIVFPFIFTSIPMAYLGSRMSIGKEVFALLLGISLFAVALRMLLPDRLFENRKEVSWNHAWKVGMPLGALLGFLAGLVGIGGGIFLSPILLLMGWANAKEAAASASFFIVVNSCAGLLGHFGKPAFPVESMVPLAIAVFVGGQIGSRLGAYHVPKVRLQQILAVLIFYVSVKLMFEIL